MIFGTVQTVKMGVAPVYGMYSKKKITRANVSKEAKMTPGEVQSHYNSYLIRTVRCFMAD